MGADDGFRDRATLPAHPVEPDTVKGGGPVPDKLTPPSTGAPRSISPFDEPRDRFESREELGRGGMGVVVEAFDRALKRPVAIKQMQSASDVDLKRFEREAEITALLEHPGIVPIHDAGRSSDGLPYYVMRRIDGDPLDQVVAKKPYAERIAKMTNLLAACDAVGFAHARGVIHRDLKPSNILIGPFGETLVIDWGLARMLDERSEPEAIRNSDAMLTRVGSVAGTPGFMAPEQARGEKLDPRADVYALGATMFYVLADAVAITASGATEMINFVGEGRTPEWNKLPEETPPELRAIIEKAMAPQRADRYRDANELAADLRRYISGQFVRAYRYGLAEQIRVFVRRHRAAVAVGVIAFVVISLGAVFSIRRILDERDDARRARAIAEQNQREAAKTRDQLLIQHALHLIEKDPAAAIAALRQLPPESSEWVRAAAVAAGAAAYGIPFGFAVPEVRESGAMAIGPSSRFVAVMQQNGRHVDVIDLHTRTRKRLMTPPALAVDWLDDRTLVLSDRTSLVFVDRESGASRSLVLPRERASVRPNGTGGGMVGLHGGDFYLIEASTSALGPPVARNARDVQMIDDDRALVTYPDHLALWSRTGPEQRIADGVSERVVASRSRVAARIGDQICSWNIVGAITREWCTSFKSYEAPAGFFNDMVVVEGPTTVVAINASRTIELSNRSRIIHAQPSGVLFFNPDMGVRIFDSQGAFSFSTGSVRVHRIAQSADERFIVGLATTGDVVIWDLSQFRPRRYDTGSQRNVFDVTARSIWLLDSIEGVVRIDRTTGANERVASGVGFLRATIDRHETWLLVGRVVEGAHLSRDVPLENRLFNLRTRLEILGEPGDSFAFSRDLALHIDRRGEVFSLAHDGTRERVGNVTGKLEHMSVHYGWMVGASATHVCRYRHPTRAVDCLPRPAIVDSVAIDGHGTAWVISGGALWRWPVGAIELKRYWPSLTFTYFTWAGENLIAAGTGLLVKLYDPVALPLAVPPMRGFLPGNEHTIYGLTTTHTVASIDVATGVTTELPLRSSVGQFTAASSAVDGAIALARTDVPGSGSDVVLYVPDTPREPAALRAWLATVTNALPIPGSDAVTWP